MKSRVVDQITNQSCSQGLSSIREEKMDTSRKDVICFLYLRSKLVGDKAHQERRRCVARNESTSFRGCPKSTLANELSPWPPSCFRQVKEVGRKGEDSQYGSCDGNNMAVVTETTWLSTIWQSRWNQCMAVPEWCATGSVTQWAWSLLVRHFFSGYTKVYPQTNPALIGSGLIWFELSTWARQDKLRLNDKVIAVTVLLKHLPLQAFLIDQAPVFQRVDGALHWIFHNIQRVNELFSG